MDDWIKCAFFISKSLEPWLKANEKREEEKRKIEEEKRKIEEERKKRTAETLIFEIVGMIVSTNSSYFSEKVNAVVNDWIDLRVVLVENRDKEEAKQELQSIFSRVKSSLDVPQKNNVSAESQVVDLSLVCQKAKELKDVINLSERYNCIDFFLKVVAEFENVEDDSLQILDAIAGVFELDNKKYQINKKQYMLTGERYVKWKTLNAHSMKEKIGVVTVLFRLRVRYYASLLLKWFGIAYCCLGIISIFFVSSACQNDLYILFGVFGIGIGLALCKFRTNRNKKALIILAITAIVFLSNRYDFNCLFETLLVEPCCYLSKLFVIPGFFVITHGHSLFGPKSLTHKQVKNACKHKIVRFDSEVLIGIMPRKRNLFHYLFTMIHLIIIYSAITVLLSMLWYTYFLRYWVVR